jgi:hypothetical protein
LLADVAGSLDQPEPVVRLTHAPFTRAEICECPGKLAARWAGLEHLDGVLGRAMRLGATAQSPKRGGQQLEIAANLAVVTEFAPQPQRDPERCLRLLPAVEQREFASDALVQGGEI